MPAEIDWVTKSRELAPISAGCFDCGWGPDSDAHVRMRDQALEHARAKKHFVWAETALQPLTCG